MNVIENTEKQAIFQTSIQDDSANSKLDTQVILNDQFKLNDCCLDLTIERNARYWLLLRDEILNDEIAKKGVGKAIKSVSIMAIAIQVPIIYLINFIYVQ